MEKELMTEERIKRSARNVFSRKGFAGARISEIANNAGVKNAMVHYYFRSKHSLFDIIMKESVMKLRSITNPFINDEQTSLEEKIDLISENLHIFLLDNQDLPMFILNELQTNTNPENFISLYFNPMEDNIFNSVFFKQLETHIKEQKLDNVISANHVFINLFSMSVFPYLSSKLLMELLELDEQEYHLLIMEGQKLGSLWVKKMLNIK